MPASGAYPFQKLSVLFAGENEAIVWCDLPRLNGRTVRVTGKVEGGKRGPVVRVTDTNQIEVLAVAVMDSLDSEGEGPAFRKQLKASCATGSRPVIMRRWMRLRRNGGRARSAYSTATEDCDLLRDVSEPVLPYPDYFRALEEWQAAFPDSITPRLLRRMRGWPMRGKPAAAVSPSRSPKKAGRRSGNALALARSERPPCMRAGRNVPSGFAIMQVVALGQGWSRPEYEALFEEAIRYEPEYLVYYDRRSIICNRNGMVRKASGWSSSTRFWIAFPVAGRGAVRPARLRVSQGLRSGDARKRGGIFPTWGSVEPMKAKQRMRPLPEVLVDTQRLCHFCRQGGRLGNDPASAARTGRQLRHEHLADVEQRRPRPDVG